MAGASTPVSPQHGPELAGQTVVLIGGSSGIVLETARRARAEGADVILTGRDRGRLEQAARDLGAQRSAPSTPPIRLPCGSSSRTCPHRSTMC